MRRGAEWRRGAPALAAILLAGCVSAPQPRVLLAPAEEARLLGALTAFSLEGRAGVSAAGEGFNAGFSWRQQGPEGRVKLSGPLGAGSIALQFGADGALQVTGSRGESLRDAEAAAAITQQLGFVPPFDALRYWVLGLPAPGTAPSSLQRDADGRLAELEQEGWRIRYERWQETATDAGLARLPQRLTATRDDVRLRVVVDRWRLR